VTVFSASKPTPETFGGKATAHLFTVAANVEAELYCVDALGAATAIRVYAPKGSVADSGFEATTSEGGPIESGNDGASVQNIELEPEYEGSSGGYILNLESTRAAPEDAIAHLSGAITTPTDVVTFDAYVESAAKTGCSVRGTAVTTPR
jgi:hypothetical protein